MAIFRKRGRKVVTQFVLGTWLFAILVSAAHACGLDEALGYEDAKAIAASTGSDNSHGAEFPACEKFCADDYPVLAKLKAVQDLPLGQTLLAPFWNAEFVRLASPAYALLPSSDPPPDCVSLNVRFLRLAL